MPSSSEVEIHRDSPPQPSRTTLVNPPWSAKQWGLLAWLVPGMASAPIQLAYSGGIVVLFTGFLFYDFSNIRLRYRLDDYVIASIQLYLDFVNLFWAILRILLIISGNGGGGRSRS